MALKVEGIDYSPEGIESIRTELSLLRAAAMLAWPEGIHETVVLTHTIALLAYLKELTEEAEGKQSGTMIDLVRASCSECQSPLLVHPTKPSECPICGHGMNAPDMDTGYASASWGEKPIFDETLEGKQDGGQE